MLEVSEEALDEMWEEDAAAALGFARSFERKDERGGFEVARHVATLIESARCHGDEPQSNSYKDRHQASRDWLARVARRALDLFSRDKQRRGLMDFADLTLTAVRLLEDGRPMPRLRYKHLLLDENQDTNPVQARLMQLVKQSCVPTL